MTCSAPRSSCWSAYLDKNGVAKMRWPERLETVSEMPMTPTRKIIKDELAKLLA